MTIRRMRWAIHVARMGEIQSLIRKTAMDNLGDFGVGGIIILQLSLKK
jgi:hypothetical protein